MHKQNHPHSNKHRRIALVTFPGSRKKLIEWSYFGREQLEPHAIVAHATAAQLLKGTLHRTVESVDMNSNSYYQMLIAEIKAGSIDSLLFFGNPFEQPDILPLHSLLAVATERDVFIALNDQMLDQFNTLLDWQSHPDVIQLPAVSYRIQRKKKNFRTELKLKSASLISLFGSKRAAAI